MWGVGCGLVGWWFVRVKGTEELRKGTQDFRKVLPEILTILDHPILSSYGMMNASVYPIPLYASL